MMIQESPTQAAASEPRWAVRPDDPMPAANRMLPMPRFELGDRLTAEQIDFFETFGFIRFKGFFSRPDTKKLVEEVEDVDRRLVESRRESFFGIPLIQGKRADGTRYVQRIPFASVH